MVKFKGECQLILNALKYRTVKINIFNLLALLFNCQLRQDFCYQQENHDSHWPFLLELWHTCTCYMPGFSIWFIWYIFRSSSTCSFILQINNTLRDLLHYMYKWIHTHTSPSPNIHFNITLGTTKLLILNLYTSLKIFPQPI